MRKIGKIIAILNEEYIIAEFKEKIAVGSVVTVQSEIESSDLYKIANIKTLILPKGELRVVADQSDSKYLLAIPVDLGKHLVLKGFDGGINQLFNNFETVVSKNKKSNAHINSEQSLGLKLDTRISIGDTVYI